MASLCTFSMVLSIIMSSTCTHQISSMNIVSSDTCSLTMFDGDYSAYMSCKAQFALQANWFPSPIAGLFSYMTWNGFDGFWQDGAVLEPMVNYMAYANHTRYLSVIKNSLRPLFNLLEAYGPYPSFDDMAWYGLSYARIYEVLGIEEFLDIAVNIYDWSWENGWDKSLHCFGGMWFDNRKVSKQTITNVQMLQLGAKLARLTKNKSITIRTLEVLDFITLNHFINSSTFLIADGITNKCTSNQVYGATYNSGVALGGFVELYKLTGNKTFLKSANKLADAAITKLTVNGILKEFCEPNCNNDAKMFKGIFARNLRYLMDISSAQFSQAYQTFLQNNVKSTISNNMCDKVSITQCNITFQDGPPYYNKSGPVFGPDWTGPFTYGAPMQQTSVMDLFISTILPGTKCTGQYCDYDPTYPSPQPLTCSSKPCPLSEDCCEYSPYTSFTCCAPDQKCNTTKGECL